MKWQIDATNLSEIFFGHSYMWVLDAVVFIMTWASSIPYFQLIGDSASKVLTINLKVSLIFYLDMLVYYTVHKHQCSMKTSL